MRRVSLWAPPIIYMTVIYAVSSQSAPLPEVTAHVWDKLLHAIEYGALAVLFYRAFRGEGLNWTAAAALSILATSGYGATDEWHQASVPLRSSDATDWIADSMGAAVAMGMYCLGAHGAPARKRSGAEGPPRSDRAGVRGPQRVRDGRS